jgi:protein required for attachment to host cells
MNNTTWILVAHRSGARLFENAGPGKGLKLVEAILHPEGRLKNGEIDSDKPGRAFDKVGGGRHSMSTEQEPIQRIAQIFAKQLGEKLEKGRAQNRYSKLVLVAEPRFLGELRAALDAPTAALVSATLDKDLIGTEDRDVHHHLENLIRL